MTLPVVLIVSPYFPPSSLAGVHRARLLAKHLPGAGWRPIVVCVDESHYEQSPDVELAKRLPPGLEIVRIGAMSARMTRAFGVGDISLRAWWSLRRAVLDVIPRRSVKAVLITGSPYYSMMLAPLIKRRFGIPVVLDFQDPWVSKWGAQQPLTSKAGLAHLVGRILEPRALDAASYVTSVSARQNVELAERYPHFPKVRMSDIAIGADPDDFAAIPSPTALIAAAASSNGHVTLAYVGTIWPPVIPTLRVLLRAVALLRGEHPAVYGQLRLLFVGTSGDPNGGSAYRVRHMAESEGVSDVVVELPQRMPYLDALSVTASAHANLVIGSDEPHYTASKIYGLLMAGRPYIAVLRKESGAYSACVAAGGGIPLGFESLDHLAAMTRQVADAIVRVVNDPESVGHADPHAYIQFQAPEIAIRFARIFDDLTKTHA